MRLREFQVRGLFGLFDQEIPFNLAERMTIIHAPNGYGKTVILNLISSFFGGELSSFRSVEFTSVSFIFDNDSTITVNQQLVETTPFTSEDSLKRTYTVTYLKDNEKEEWNPFTPPDPDSSRRGLMPSMVDRYLPHLSRVSGREWRDPSQRDVINLGEVIERYWTHLPEAARHGRKGPDWLEAIRSSVHCQLIETQRLLPRKKRALHGTEREISDTTAVRAYGQELAETMATTLAESATLSQSLDRTFPNRVLAGISGDQRSLSEEELRLRLAQLEQKRSRLTKVDLLKRSDDNALIPAESFDAATKRILTEYVEDTEKKLGIFDDLLARVELFTDLLNSRLNFKTVLISRSSGFAFIDVKDRLIKPDSLSSGEQHELILFYDLIFRTQPGTLILIDEPEISLHIAWQKKFMSDIERIIELKPLDVLVSTHSPQLISHHRDLVVKLRRPNV